MTLFTPPMPKTLKRHATLRQKLDLLLRSSLAVFLEGSYGVTGASRLRIPTLPFARRRSILLVRDAAAIRTMLAERADDFPKGRLMETMLEALTGHSIFVSNGDVWRRQRRIIDQAFENARIRDVFGLMRDASDALVRRFGELAVRGAPVEIEAEMTHFAGDIIFRTLFSEPLRADDARRIFAAFDVFQRLSYGLGMLGLTGLPLWLLPSYWRARRAARRIRAVLQGPLGRRMAALAAGQTAPQDDILATLISATDPVTGTKLDAGELLDQVAMLFLAGHETSAAALGWTLYCIANSPCVQERMRAESLAAYKDRPDFSDMRRMPFVRDVFRETLRLYPPIAFFARDVAGAGALCGKPVAAGDSASIGVWLMHRHSAHWSDPHAFDPGRFARDETREAQRCAYMPFSMGQRVCVGAAFALQEATLVLGELVRRFEFTPVAGRVPEPIARLTVRSDNGIWLRVASRPQPGEAA